MGLFDSFKKKKEKIKKDIAKTYTIEFPYRGIIELEDLEEDSEDDEYISGKDVYLYLDQNTIDGINMSWNESNMTEFINNTKVKSKIADIELSIKENGICNMYVKAYEELTDEDKEYVLNYIKGQASDGWGEDNFDYIYDKNNKKIYFYWDSKDKAEDDDCIPFSIQFWWDEKDWYIKYL